MAAHRQNGWGLSSVLPLERTTNHFHPGVGTFNIAVGDDMIVEYYGDED